MVYDEYRWKDGFVAVGGVEAQDVGERLHDLEKEHGGITPEIIIGDAVSENSVMHPMFEWNNDKAANHWRVNQARKIIQYIITIEKSGMPEVRTYVSIVAPDDSVLDRNRIYISSRVAMADKLTRKQVLQDAWNGILRWRERYKAYKELGALCEAIDKESRNKKARPGKVA